MDVTKNQRLGVIEGFYGRAWSAGDRAAVIPEFANLGYGNYIYAPKSDNKLRRDWQVAWSDYELQQLQTLSATCRAESVGFGVGFSPLGLGGITGAKDRAFLASKVEQIRLIGCETLCILFDDMRESGKLMARNQLHIIDYLSERCEVKNIIVCPSYYTTDPVLEKVFGPRPENYWADLGRGLDASLNIFWTGERVCSASFNQDNLDFIASEFRRKPSLWDNYPVNDGERMSQFLHLLPFAGRASWLQDYTAHHFANGMNQAHLSLLPLSTLPAVYTDASRSELDENVDALDTVQANVEQANVDGASLDANWCDFLSRQCPALSENLVRDAPHFQTKGLENFTEQECAALIESYVAIDSPLAQEIVAWLRGEYVFDPACLTN
jgi:hyaluronoglucosaminidase